MTAQDVAPAEHGEEGACGGAERGEVAPQGVELAELFRSSLDQALSDRSPTESVANVLWREGCVLLIEVLQIDMHVFSRVTVTLLRLTLLSRSAWDFTVDFSRWSMMCLRRTRRLVGEPLRRRVRVLQR